MRVNFGSRLNPGEAGRIPCTGLSYPPRLSVYSQWLSGRGSSRRRTYARRDPGRGSGADARDLPRHDSVGEPRREPISKRSRTTGFSSQPRRISDDGHLARGRVRPARPSRQALRRHRGRTSGRGQPAPATRPVRRRGSRAPLHRFHHRPDRLPRGREIDVAGLVRQVYRSAGYGNAGRPTPTASASKPTSAWVPSRRTRSASALCATTKPSSRATPSICRARITCRPNTGWPLA
jgi:hypothetical protein